MGQPFVIESDETYAETMVIIYNLMNKGESNLEPGELEKLENMATAAEKYEDEILHLTRRIFQPKQKPPATRTAFPIKIYVNKTN